MILSYAGRLVCVAMLMGGLIHAMVEGFLWVVAPLALRAAGAFSTRWRERFLYAIQFAPALGALVLTGMVCVPQYLRSETNLEAESVGWLCVAGTVAVGTWYGAGLLRGLAVAARTAFYVRSCRRASSGVWFVRDQMRVLSYPGDERSVALVGLFRPFVLVPESLLGEGGLSSHAIDIVLDHEASHARQLDNWKLLSLLCVPTLRLRLRNGRTWTEMWRSAAEWAADEDAVRGEGDRTLVLAETLVTVARGFARQADRVCMSLTNDEADLAARIGRLLEVTRPADARCLRRTCELAVGMAALFALLLAAILRSPDLVERLLHLGMG